MTHKGVIRIAIRLWFDYDEKWTCSNGVPADREGSVN